MITCPKCGRQTAEGAFCERCGAELSAPVLVRGPGPVSASPAAAASALHMNPVRTAEPLRAVEPVRMVEPVRLESRTKATLAIDRVCLLFENLTGLIRFWIDPGTGAGWEDVRLTFENQLTGLKVTPRPLRFLDMPRELSVQFPPAEAGTHVWCLTVEYESGARKRRLEGEVQTLVVRPAEAQKVAEKLSINIETHVGNVGAAADVTVNQRAADELAKLAKAENPFDELRRIVAGPARMWEGIGLYDACSSGTLPPIPAEAVTDRVSLDFGIERIVFFANRTVKFGRSRDLNDIWLRPTDMTDAAAVQPYKKVSREHCFFEHRGDAVAISDGHRDEFRVVQPSTGGTYLDDAFVEGERLVKTGTAGVIAFGDPGCAGALSMEVRACSPSRACASCPHANRRWCEEGRRPSLMLTRRDGIPERFVAVWSCFDLGEADPSFVGTVIFRKDGGFAWRRGRRCGWLVPGTTIATELGEVKVDAASSAAKQ